MRLQISDFMLLAGQSVAYGQWVIAVDEPDWKVSHPEGCASVTFTYLIGSREGPVPMPKNRRGALVMILFLRHNPMICVSSNTAEHRI